MTDSSHTTAHPDWNALSTAWRSLGHSSPPDPVALRSRVDAQSRRAHYWRVAEVIVSVLALVMSLIEMRARPGVSGRLVMVDTLVVLAVAWTFAWFHREARRSPLGDTTEAYLKTAKGRVTQRVRLVWLTLALLVAQWMFVEIAALGVSRVSLVFTALWLAWAAAEWRSARRELGWVARFDDGPERAPAQGK